MLGYQQGSALSVRASTLRRRIVSQCSPSASITTASWRWHEACDIAHGRTHVSGEPRGARFDREVQFVDGEGKVLVSALTRWVMLDRETTRPARITAEIAAPFRSE